MKPQRLTLDGVKRAARRAYRAHKLTAQDRDPTKRKCRYVAGSHVCAIGAALNHRVRVVVMDMNASRCLNGAGILTLCNEGIVDISGEDLPRIAYIQEAHDIWCSAGQGARPEARMKFLELIKP